MNNNNFFLPNEKTIKFKNIRNKLNLFSYIFFDFDNTLMPWGSYSLSENIIQHFNKLYDDGLSIYIVTNGKGNRIKNLKKSIPDHIKVLDNAKKPRLRKIKQFVEENKIDPRKSLFIGDNLITDIYVGNKLGMYTIKVNPIAKKEYWATKIYRMIELIIYFLYRKEFRELDGKSHNHR